MISVSTPGGASVSSVVAILRAWWSIMEGEERTAFAKVKKSFAAWSFGQSWTLEEQLAADTLTDNHVERGGFSAVWTHSWRSFAA